MKNYYEHEIEESQENREQEMPLFMQPQEVEAIAEQAQSSDQIGETIRQMGISPERLILNVVTDLVCRNNKDININDTQKIAEIFASKAEYIYNDWKRMSGEYQQLFEMVKEEPRIAKLISELIEGKPMRVALLNAEITNIDPQYGDEDFDQYQVALKELREKRADAERHRHNCECNSLCTRVELERFLLNKKLSPEMIEQFTEFLHKFIENIFDGLLNEDMLEKIWKGFAFEKEVEMVKDIALVEGRNMQIDSRRNKIITSDGLARAGGGTIDPAPKKTGYIERIMTGEY